MARPIEDHWKRFWELVEKADACWNWKGTLSDSGHGRFYRRRVGRKIKWQQAHRWSWEWHIGPIPDGKRVLHRCDNPACVNPDHLYIGDHRANMADRQNRKRQARGDRHGKSKLTEDRVRWLREQLVLGRSRRELAAELGVSWSTITNVVLGRAWKHVT